MAIARASRPPTLYNTPIPNLLPSQGMVKNHCLAQSISDASFGLFRQLLAYKAEQYGTLIVVADRFYPSSKRCSACGSVKDELSLGERTYRCECGLSLDRDLNAALNLMQLGTACPEVTLTDSHRTG
jgi:putative transposase